MFLALKSACAEKPIPAQSWTGINPRGTENGRDGNPLHAPYGWRNALAHITPAGEVRMVQWVWLGMIASWLAERPAPSNPPSRWPPPRSAYQSLIA